MNRNAKIFGAILLLAASTAFCTLKLGVTPTNYVRAPYTSDIDFSTTTGKSFTACAWVFYTGSMPDSAIMAQQRSSPASYSGWMIWTGGAGSTSLHIYVNGADRGSYTLAGLGYHHIALVYDTTKYYLFDNGIQKATSGAFSTGPQNLVNDVIIGAYYNLGTDNGSIPQFRWQERILDVRLYNRALSSTELLSLAKSGTYYPITDGLVRWYKMDEGIPGEGVFGTVIKDSSQFNITAIAASTPSYVASSPLSYQ